MININNTLDFTISTAKSAGKILMDYYGNISDINRKSTVDLVTNADLESEIFIIKKIKEFYPLHDIIAEESDVIKQGSNYRWVIDPLDGTTNFVHNFPIFSVSIALQYKSETIIGVVYNPIYNQCFYASKSKGAYLNGTSISPSTISNLQDSLLVTGFPYNHDVLFDKSFELFHDLYSRTQGIRRLGAASLDFCFVAMGRFEAYYEFNLKPWDICAGDLILRESGGKTSDWKDSLLPFSGNRILASNGVIHDEILSILQHPNYSIFIEE